MTKIKKEKKNKVIETPIEEPIEPVVETPIEEPVEEPVVEESAAIKELRNIYAVAKAQNPELYALKEKDKQLQKRLKELK